MNLQSHRPRRLNLIQDVSVRWNSTFNMLVRIYKLKSEVKDFCREEKKVSDLTIEQWRHVEYLIEILYPFCIHTNAIGRTINGPTIHNVFPSYDMLFDHLEHQIEKLQRKRIPWKIRLRESLEKGRDQLRRYYSKTKDDLGDIYGVATMLAPRYKTSFFDNTYWKEDGGINWVSI